MNRLAQDLRYALRGLRARPLISLVIILTLALGIGASTAVFSVVHGVLLDPLPYDRPERLIKLYPDQLLPFGTPAANHIDESAQTFEVAGWTRTLFPLAGAAGPEDARGALVFENHFRLLGARPALGRLFEPADGEAGATEVVVLSHSLWARRYGRDPEVVGKTILIAGQPHEVIGVMGPRYQPMERDWLMWQVAQRETEAFADRPWALNGRLRPGYTVSQAQQELRRLLPEFWMSHHGYQATPEEIADMRVVPLRDWILGDGQAMLWALMGAVLSMLLIVCANVTNLLLAQGNARRPEMAVRLALGAGRGRLVRQLLTESTLVGAAGGVLGVLVALALVQAGVANMPPQLPRLHNIAVDAPVLAFAVAVSLLSILLFGTLPAWRATRRSVARGLQGNSSRHSLDASGLRFNRALVASQIALMVVLISGAGLMLRSLWTLLQIDPGFEARGVVVMRPSPPRARYPDQASLDEYHRRVRRAAEGVPGVVSVGQIQFLPMHPGGWRTSYRAAGRPLEPGQDASFTNGRVVTPGYFTAMRTPLVRGREFEASDGADGQPVVIVNQSLARSAWPGEDDPVGKELLLGRDERRLRVVGIVADVRQSGLRQQSVPEFYVPLAQQSWRRMFLVVRVDGPARSMVPLLQQAVWSVDAEVALSHVGLMSDAVNATIADSRLLASLLSGFGALALLLGAVGVYGVMSYTVSLRRRELGIRLALGAGGCRLLRSTILGGLIPVVLGLLVGLPAALLSSGWLSGVLYRTPAHDPLTFLLALLVLLVVACVALYFPARRASRIDPVTVLRADSP
ncbi:MAG TPA: ABC transporter permease [Acidobacteriota bacterium]|nr:ABC transporter permease [Acidobacteriota bacterium]